MAGPNIIEQIKLMPLKQKAVLLVSTALLVAAGITLVTWLKTADYQLLYANLSEEDGAAIAQKLAELKVPARTTAGGIMVPADRVYELRLQMAGQGLPQGGGVGYEVFDKTNFTMTDFVQKLNYRRALQGELSRTIRALGEVEQCRVHLAVPEKTLFLQKAEAPKASVLVKLKAGRKLSPGRVQGIVHLVASSVEGLDPKDVSVVDTNGDLLTAPVRDEAVAATSSQLDHQRTFERDLEARIVGMLEPVTGAGKARARVAASFDFTKTEKTEEKFDPDSQVARSEQRSVEKSGSGSAGGGVPGTASNLPGAAAPSAAGGRSQSERKNETINYEISKTVSHSVSPAGGLKRLSVVVLVDGTSTAVEGAKDRKYTPRAEEDLKQFEEMVKKTVGFSADRGDEVKVVNMPFETTPVEELGEAGPAASEFLPLAMTAVKYLAPLAGVVLLFLFVVKPLIRAVAQSAPPMVAQPALPQTVAQLEQAMQGREVTTQGQLTDWAKKNPKDAANLIRGWIDEK